jgi:hypothetical protein
MRSACHLAGMLRPTSSSRCTVSLGTPPHLYSNSTDVYIQSRGTGSHETKSDLETGSFVEALKFRYYSTVDQSELFFVLCDTCLSV